MWYYLAFIGGMSVANIGGHPFSLVFVRGTCYCVCMGIPHTCKYWDKCFFRAIRGGIAFFYMHERFD